MGKRDVVWSQTPADIVNKPLKNWITLNLDGGTMNYGYNKLLEGDQEMVEEVQETKQINLENKIFNVLHNSQIGQKESQIEQEDEGIFNPLQLNSINVKMKYKKMN